MKNLTKSLNAMNRNAALRSQLDTLRDAMALACEGVTDDATLRGLQARYDRDVATVQAAINPRSIWAR